MTKHKQLCNMMTVKIQIISSIILIFEYNVKKIEDYLSDKNTALCNVASQVGRARSGARRGRAEPKILGAHIDRQLPNTASSVSGEFFTYIYCV